MCVKDEDTVVVNDTVVKDGDTMTASAAEPNTITDVATQATCMQAACKHATCESSETSDTAGSKAMTNDTADLSGPSYVGKYLTRILDTADVVYFVTYVDPREQYKFVSLRNMIGVMDVPDVKTIDLRQLFYLINPSAPSSEYDYIRDYYGVRSHRSRYVEYMELMDLMVHEYNLGPCKPTTTDVDHTIDNGVASMQKVTRFYNELFDEIYDRLNS
jgi:hypothetical protein